MPDFTEIPVIIRRRRLGLKSNVDEYGRIWIKAATIWIEHPRRAGIKTDMTLIDVRVDGITGGGWKYPDSEGFFRSWEIIDRRVLVEKTGYAI